MKYMDWDNMHTRLEALYILDNALTDPSEDDLRLVRKKKLEYDKTADDIVKWLQGIFK